MANKYENLVDKDILTQYDNKIKSFIAKAITAAGSGSGGSGLTEEQLAQINQKIKANTDAITTLNGESTVPGSVRKQVADAIALVMENDDSAMNSIKEIVDWINAHPSDATELNQTVQNNKSDIQALQALVGTIPGGATSSTIVDYITEKTTGLLTSADLSTYAKTETVNTLTDKVDKNTNDIIAINADNTGILAQSKRYTDSKAKQLIDETLNTSFSICSISAIDALFPDE